jgi:hypothetical protein
MCASSPTFVPPSRCCCCCCCHDPPQEQQVHSAVAGVGPAGLPCCAAASCWKLPAAAAEGCAACGPALTPLQGETTFTDISSSVCSVVLPWIFWSVFSNSSVCVEEEEYIHSTKAGIPTPKGYGHACWGDDVRCVFPDFSASAAAVAHLTWCFYCLYCCCCRCCCQMVRLTRRPCPMQWCGASSMDLAVLR